MRVRILLQMTGDDGIAGAVEEIAAFEKVTERPEQVGLSLAEGKTVLAAVQHGIVHAQVEFWMNQHRCCDACGVRRRSKGSYPVLFRTLYGDVPLLSHRLHRCPCRPDTLPASTSPLRDLLPDHVAPERLYLETRWASLVPYAADAELGDERSSFIDGCPAEWAALPIFKTLSRIKWLLWHGNQHRAQQEFRNLRDHAESSEVDYEHLKRFRRSVHELAVYISLNGGSLINYGERYRSGERISSAMAESTVNPVISKRFAKRQQMQWTKRGAHLLLQTRTRTLDGTLRPTFERWYPGLHGSEQVLVAA